MIVKKNDLGDHSANFQETEHYIVSGLTKSGTKYVLCTNGLNSPSWRSELYAGVIAQFKELDYAKHEADHAPECLETVTIERINVKQFVFSQTEIEIVKYEPKCLGELIPF